MISFVVDSIRCRRTLAQGACPPQSSRGEGGFSDCAYPLSVAACRCFHQITTTSLNRAKHKSAERLLVIQKKTAAPPFRAAQRPSVSSSVLLSQGESPQLSSALESLTSVFGMGTGVTSPLLLLNLELSAQNWITRCESCMIGVLVFRVQNHLVKSSID